MKLGLIIGRFQPLHNGHVAIIQKAMDENDVVLVLVGSAGKLPDYKNPFSVEDRIGMLEGTFGHYDRMHFKGLADYPSNAEWLEDVTSRVNTIQDDPSKVTLYTSEKDEEFYQENFLYAIEAANSKGLNATDIRQSVYNDGSKWFNKVPKATEDFLDSYIGTAEWKRVRAEYFLSTQCKKESEAAHKFSNPLEPVAHAMVIQDNKVLLVKRKGTRGKGQWALPGGYIENTETTRSAALRELKEETGVDLLNTSRSAEVAMAVEENMDDLSTPTLGINYAYAVHKDEELNPVAGDDAEAVKWASLEDICEGKEPLFYNHVTIIRRLLAGIK